MGELEIAKRAQQNLRKLPYLCLAFEEATTGLGVCLCPAYTEAGKAPAIFAYIQKELSAGLYPRGGHTVASWLAAVYKGERIKDFDGTLVHIRKTWMQHIVDSLEAGESFASLAAKADGSTLAKIWREVNA